MSPDKVAKAIIGGVTAAAAAYGVAVQNGPVTVAGWVTIAASGILAGLAVWATPNAPAIKPPPQP